MAAPVTLDQELELRIDSLAFGGNGVARLTASSSSSAAACPGDLVRARVTKVKRNHAEALTVDVLEPGPVRVDAPCAHYPACGGCRFQDLAYEAQIEAKESAGSRRAAADRRLRRAAARADPARRVTFHYRNKLEYSFTQTHEGPAPACTAPGAGTRCCRSRRAG